MALKMQEPNMKGFGAPVETDESGEFDAWGSRHSYLPLEVSYYRYALGWWEIKWLRDPR